MIFIPLNGLGSQCSPAHRSQTQRRETFIKLEKTARSECFMCNCMKVELDTLCYVGPNNSNKTGRGTER